MYNNGNYLGIDEIKRLLPHSFLPLKQIDRKLIFKAGQKDLLAVANSRIYDKSGEHLWSCAFLDYFRKARVTYICHTVGRRGVLLIPMSVLDNYANYANSKPYKGELRYFLRIRIENDRYILHSKDYELDLTQYFISYDDDTYIDVINQQDYDKIMQVARSFVDYEEQYLDAHSHKVRHESRCQKERIATIENHTCQICGFYQPYTNTAGKQRWIIEVDHILPKSEGGGETIDNLLVLCPNCHAKKTAGIIKVNSDFSYTENGIEKVLLVDKHLKV